MTGLLSEPANYGVVEMPQNLYCSLSFLKIKQCCSPSSFIIPGEVVVTKTSQISGLSFLCEMIVCSDCNFFKKSLVKIKS